jgi:hypothetical protein
MTDHPASPERETPEQIAERIVRTVTARHIYAFYDDQGRDKLKADIVADIIGGLAYAGAIWAAGFGWAVFQ